jgi:hypothetical protein
MSRFISIRDLLRKFRIEVGPPNAIKHGQGLTIGSYITARITRNPRPLRSVEIGGVIVLDLVTITPLLDVANFGSKKRATGL